MTTYFTMCAFCKHFRLEGDKAVCDAFPGGIPEGIIKGSVDHRLPFDDDGGIRFAPADAEAEKIVAEQYGPLADNWKPIRKITGVDPEDDALFGAMLSADGAAVMDEDGMPHAAEFIGGPANDEAVYLIDRLLAPTDEHYLVPVTYQTSRLGVSGIVTIKPKGGRAVRNIERFSDLFSAHAAALDYIAGVTRPIKYVLRHPLDFDRPILPPTGESFGEPNSVFVDKWRGQPLPEDVIRGAETVAGDHGLWRDVAEIVGQEAADKARERAAALAQAGVIPEVLGVA